MSKFFMILRNDGKQSGAYKRHDDYSEAKQEAERLCRKEGCQFVLLEAIEVVCPINVPIKWEKCFP